jgi:cyclopropane fatty-acyl-phospholipid synthase-like methyltransferase
LEEQIAKIEARALDNEAVSRISLHFDSEKDNFEMPLDEEVKYTDVLFELEMLESKLQIALETANSRFKLENRGIWAKAFNGFFDKLAQKHGK